MGNLGAKLHLRKKTRATAAEGQLLKVRGKRCDQAKNELKRAEKTVNNLNNLIESAASFCQPQDKMSANERVAELEEHKAGVERAIKPMKDVIDKGDCRVFFGSFTNKGECNIYIAI